MKRIWQSLQISWLRWAVAVVVKNGRVIGLVELRIAGLMSSEKADVVAKKAETVLVV